MHTSPGTHGLHLRGVSGHLICVHASPKATSKQTPQKEPRRGATGAEVAAEAAAAAAISMAPALPEPVGKVFHHWL